jgi:Lon-like ATP-dependent protease
MLARAMAQLLPREEPTDVLVRHDPCDGNAPLVEVVPAGEGAPVVAAAREAARGRFRRRRLLLWVAVALVLGHAVLVANGLLTWLLAAGVVSLVFRASRRRTAATVPSLRVDNAGRSTAPFVDATGAHAGALPGDVRHDPFQSGGSRRRATTASRPAPSTGRAAACCSSTRSTRSTSGASST